MAQTKIVKVDPLNINEDYIRQAAEIIKNGGLVIIPTETVYGIAGDFLNQKATARMSEIKKRPKDKPFAAAIDKKEKIEEFAREVPQAAYKLIHQFWPGPLTIILKGINKAVTAGPDFPGVDGGHIRSIGLRMPDNAIALKVIAESSRPLALSSANLSGEPAPVNFESAIKSLDGRVDLAIDSGPLKIGVESTVVDFTSKTQRIVRLGAIKEEEINKTIARKNILFVCSGNTCRSVMAEAFFKKMMRDEKRFDIGVFSAGVMAVPGIGVSQSAKEVLAREGIDISNHVSQRATREMLRQSDLVLVMEREQENAVLKLAPEVENRVFLLKEFADPVRNNNLIAKIPKGAKIDGNELDIADPMGKPLSYYENTFASIKEALERVKKLI
ncbi:MAG: L-threonylcarbamoyladenylate synthase [Candidatus Omnitrophota bacterium]